ncbi:hypothetical protein BH09VER1_BH09VER1_24560 [soil metagenome]
MNRSIFSGGPAFIIRNGISIQLMADWKAETEIVTKDRSTNLRGRVGAWEDYTMTKITGRAVVTATNLAALLAELFPYTPAMVGQTIFPDVDLPLVIQTKDGRSITYAASALTKMPDVNLAPGEDLLGDFEYTCLLANGADAADDDSHVVEASSSYTEPTLNPLGIIAARYDFAWGAISPFDAIETDEKGVSLKPKVSFNDLQTQRDGLQNMRIKEVTAELGFTPVNLASEDFYNLVIPQGSSAGRGKAMGARGLAFTATPLGSGAGRPSLSVPLAVPTKSPLQFGSNSRIGDVTMMCEQKATVGVIGDLFTLAATTE